jgi:trehalose 6-phosphate synthase
MTIGSSDGREPWRDRRTASGGSAELVVVANRLPVRRVSQDGTEIWATSPGGLVSALQSVTGALGCSWVGWSGASGEFQPPKFHNDIRLHNVPLSDAEYEDFYLGFSNGTLWPLYHDAIRPARFEREWWQSYVEVNERYAQEAASVAGAGAKVWVHDYQLQLVPSLLRKLRPDLSIGFFLHIPFPPQELFMQLPWRRQILEGMAGADLLGFQVPGAASNFARLARRVLGARGTSSVISYQGRDVKLGAFPISVDTEKLDRMASDPAIQARSRDIRAELDHPEVIMLGVDRLDYTKGIDLRITALGELYREGSLDPSKHVLVQVASPSRDDGEHYQAERRHLEQLVSEVNGDYGRVGRPAINYLHQNIEIEELVAMYLAADVMLVTPFRDGMNLVAKEYVMCRAGATGVLVLSEFAGAATELEGGAVMVNPHDLDGIKSAILHSVSLPPREAAGRMRRLRRTVLRNDVHRWAQSFMDALDAPSGELQLPTSNATDALNALPA